MLLTDADWQAIALTLQTATLTTAILLLVGTPLAWWLARTRSRLKAPVAALVSLPFVLPPSVLGFYLLVGMGPHGPVGQFTQAMGWGVLPFTFAATGNADVGFVAMAQVLEGGRLKSGSMWVVPQHLYNPIKQDAVLMQTSASNEAAQALMKLLKSPAIKDLIRSYGYDL